MGLNRTTDATIEPVTREEVKEHLRITHGDEDQYLDSLITAARQYVEERTGRQLISATWTQTFDRFPTCGPLWQIELDRPPLLSTTTAGGFGITYFDSDGTSTTMPSSDYRVVNSGHKGRVTPAFGASWPSTRYQTDAVTITYKAGYGTTAASVPKAIKQAILLYIELLYDELRGTGEGKTKSVQEAIDRLLSPYDAANYR